MFYILEMDTPFLTVTIFEEGPLGGRRLLHSETFETAEAMRDAGWELADFWCVHEVSDETGQLWEDPRITEAQGRGY